MMKRVEANDPTSICMLATHYHLGRAGFQQDHAKAIELYARAADLGCSDAHSNLGILYHEGGYMKKAKFHFEAAAMAGNEVARHNLAICEKELGNMDRSVKHLKIGASAGDSRAMQSLLICFKQGVISRESINSTLIAYNSSCAEMRSEARDAYMRRLIDRISER
jgi:TPR repeat protein